MVLQSLEDRLKIDLITSQEKIVIPPASKGKGLFGPGPAHLRLKKLRALMINTLLFASVNTMDLKPTLLVSVLLLLRLTKLQKERMLPKLNLQLRHQSLNFQR